MPQDQPYVFAVGQQPFEVDRSRFCTLVPICTLDGSAVSARDDFPNRGLCWWMVRGSPELERAEPGQLLIAPVEDSVSDRSHPDKDWLQARWPDARLGGDRNLLEVLEAGAEGQPRSLIDPRRPLRLDHVPSALVLARLGGRTYGPFKTHVIQRDDGGGSLRYEVELRSTAQPEVMELNDDDLAAVGGLVVTGPVRVSLEPIPVTHPRAATCEIVYRFLPWARFEALRDRRPRRVRIEPEFDLIRRVSREYLRPRDKAQALMGLLREFEEALDASSAADADSALQLVRGWHGTLALAETHASELAEALVASGLLQSQVERGIDARFQQHLESRAAEAQATIESRIAEAEQRRGAIEAEINGLEAFIEQDKRDARLALDREIGEARRQADLDLTAIRQQLDEQKLRLEQERSQLAGALAIATTRFQEGREQVLGDALALQPVLKLLGLAAAVAPTESVAGPPPPPRAPSWPAWFGRPPPARDKLDERTFLDRFMRYTEAAGFRFREADLRAFHLLAKCSDLTILGGPSGTGKSSLIRLYAAALAGEEVQARGRLLVVDVSPSWTEPADLFGTTNLLDRRFEPGPTGAFWHLAAAAREHHERPSSAGIVALCLDEMNLAQPEYYLAGLMQALERPARSVAVFSPDSVQPDDPARDFALLPLPPTLRLFGTVNFDETTRPLSLRLRDRACVLELSIERQAGLSPRPGIEAATVSGPAVTLADMAAWTPDGSLPEESAAMLDRLQPMLTVLSAPVTPRRAQAIRRMLAASRGVLDPAEALDLALATRVMPLIRNAQRGERREALDQLRAALAGHRGGPPRAIGVLDQIVQTERDMWDEFAADT